MFLFQNVNCSSGNDFGAGQDFIRRKTRKNKKQNKLFCFHHHHRPTRRHRDANLQERGKKSKFLLSLLIVGSLGLKKILKTFKKVKNLT
jgi:hypothetical protein